jgi:hypothetical protein
MSIKPIHYQLSVPKAMEVAKTRSDEQIKELSQQQNQAAAIQHQAEDSIKHVHKKDEAEEARIREKQEREEQSEKKHQSNNSDNEKKDKSSPKNVETKKNSSFDVKI